MCHTMITAHSGCEGTKPNSQEQIEKVLQSSFEATEVDIRMVDNTLILAHDDVEALSPDIFTVEQFFEMIKDSPLRVNCDLKHNFLVEPVCNLARQYGLESRLFFTGTTKSRDLQFIKESMVFANLENYFYRANDTEDLDGIKRQNFFIPMLTEILTLLKLDGFHGVNAYYKVVDKDFMHICRHLNLKAIAWTVDEESEFTRLSDLKLYSITTNQPTNAMKFLTDKE